MKSQGSCSDCFFYSCSPQSLRRHCCHTAKSAETEIPRAAVEELFSDVGKLRQAASLAILVCPEADRETGLH